MKTATNHTAFGRFAYVCEIEENTTGTKPPNQIYKYTVNPKTTELRTELD
jgi:hypothetical protein